jgi:hypothetical protein
MHSRALRLFYALKVCYGFKKPKISLLGGGALTSVVDP